MIKLNDCTHLGATEHTLTKAGTCKLCKMGPWLASELAFNLQVMINAYGDFPVEIDANGALGIVPMKSIRFEETDAERGNTIVIEGE